jgi:hypothetical protein
MSFLYSEFKPLPPTPKDTFPSFLSRAEPSDPEKYIDKKQVILELKEKITKLNNLLSEETQEMTKACSPHFFEKVKYRTHEYKCNRCGIDSEPISFLIQ